MPVMLQGIRVDDLKIGRDGDKGAAISGSYSLLSSNGKVVAKQAFGGGYHDIQFTPSPATVKALDALLQSVTHDMNAVMGLDESTPA